MHGNARASAIRARISLGSSGPPGRDQCETHRRPPHRCSAATSALLRDMEHCGRRPHRLKAGDTATRELWPMPNLRTVTTGGRSASGQFRPDRFPLCTRSRWGNRLDSLDTLATRTVFSTPSPYCLPNATRSGRGCPLKRCRGRAGAAESLSERVARHRRCGRARPMIVGPVLGRGAGGCAHDPCGHVLDEAADPLASSRAADARADRPFVPPRSSAGLMPQSPPPCSRRTFGLMTRGDLGGSRPWRPAFRRDKDEAPAIAVAQLLRDSVPVRAPRLMSRSTSSRVEDVCAEQLFPLLRARRANGSTAGASWR